MILLALLLACHPEPWTMEGALRPSLARLDQDGDGRVDAREYERVAFSAPPFAQVDASFIPTG